MKIHRMRVVIKNQIMKKKEIYNINIHNKMILKLKYRHRKFFLLFDTFY